MANEREKVNAYLETVNRLEPDITPIDLPAAAASIAISLKRIADSLEVQCGKSKWTAAELFLAMLKNEVPAA